MKHTSVRRYHSSDRARCSRVAFLCCSLNSCFLLLSVVERYPIKSSKLLYSGDGGFSAGICSVSTAALWPSRDIQEQSPSLLFETAPLIQVFELEVTYSQKHILHVRTELQPLHMLFFLCKRCHKTIFQHIRKERSQTVFFSKFLNAS